MRAQIGEDLKLVDQYFPNQIGKSKFRSLGEAAKGRTPVASSFKAAAKAMDSDEELLTTALSIKNYDQQLQAQATEARKGSQNTQTVTEDSFAQTTTIKVIPTVIDKGELIEMPPKTTSESGPRADDLGTAYGNSS